MTTLSDRLWRGSAATYDEILAHPFLAGLTDGSLDDDAFSHYVVQDALYLVDFARSLAGLAVTARTAPEVAMWSRHAAGAIEVERALHETLLTEVGIDPAVVPATAPAPTTRAYTSWLVATVTTGSHAEGVAAVLPCYWIYREVGRELARKGSPDPRFQRWIDTYADDAFDMLVEEVLAVTDALPVADEQVLHERFATAARFEWMFWDAAWRRERWPGS